MLKRVVFATILIASVALPATAQTYTCVRTGQATTATAPGILDLACTENVTPVAEHDFRIRPARSSTSYARFSVVALSRPFGAVVIDARVECSDGTFYEPEFGGATDPLAVGQAGGEVAFAVDNCAAGTTWNRLTLTPRFPEWKCDGCGSYTPTP